MLIVEIAAVAIVAGLLVWAAVVDWRRREIPDEVSIGIAVLSLPFWWATGVEVWPGAAIQVAFAAGAFAVFFGVFALGQMGGGDVKLITALALFLAPFDFVQMLIVMALAGAVLTVVMVVRHRVRKASGLFENPYGIAISFAGLAVISVRYLNHFA